MERCNDPTVGELITQYEMGQLRDEERDRFEEHLLDCEFCRRELAEMLSTASAMRKHKDDILEGLHEEGISFESMKERLLARQRPGEIRRKSPKEIWGKIIRGLGTLGRPRTRVFVAVATAALLLLAILPIFRQPENPYVSYLTFEKLPYRPLTLRGEKATEAESLFYAGMENYLIDDYEGAVGVLKNAVKKNPDNGAWWLYLGVSYYLDRQGKQAIEALKKADALAQHSLRIRTRWYLAQAHLLQGDVNGAIPFLEWVREQRREYSAKADSLVKLVRSVKEDQRD